MTQATITQQTASTGRTAEPRGPVAERRRGVNVAVWTLQVLLAGVYVMASVPKLMASSQAVEGFADMGLGMAGMYVIGALELAGAVALLVPRLCGLAGVAFVGLMVGAVIATVGTLGLGTAVFPAVMLVLVAVVAWARRRRTAELVSTVRGWVR